MAKGLPRRYFDASPLIRLFENQPGDGPIVQALIEEAAANRWVLVVSAMTMLEVTRVPGKPVDPAKRAAITRFFENPYIFFREIDRGLAEQALDLVYHHLSLRPRDAIHVAAAIDTRCEVMYTYDGDLIRTINGEHGLVVTEPQMPEPPKEPELTDLPLFKPTDNPPAIP